MRIDDQPVRRFDEDPALGRMDVGADFQRIVEAAVAVEVDQRHVVLLSLQRDLAFAVGGRIQRGGGIAELLGEVAEENA